MIERFPQRKEINPYDQDVFTDPIVKEVMVMARDMQTYLDSLKDPDEKILERAVKVLNHSWPYHNRQIQISGWLQEYSYRKRSWEDIQWCEDTPALSQGFLVQNFSEGSQTKPIIAFNLHCRDETSKTVHQVAARLDSQVRYPFDSLDAARKRLAHFCPEGYDQITTILTHAQSETEIFRSLSKIKLKQNPRAQFNIGKDMARHINDLLYFDSVPYIAEINGDYYQMNGREAEPADNGENVLAIQPERLEYVAPSTEEESHYRLPALIARQLTKDRHQQPPQILIPLRAISDIRSMRDQFYQSEP